jgi:hypothetical protein
MKEINDREIDIISTRDISPLIIVKSLYIKLEVGLLSRTMRQVLLFLIRGGQVRKHGSFIMVFRPPTIQRETLSFFSNNP